MEGLNGEDVGVTGDVAPGRGRGRPDAGGGSDVRWSDRPLTSVKRVPLILALLASLLLFLAGTADSTSIKGKKGRKIARSRVKSRAAIRALCNRNQAAHSSGSPSERHARVKSTVRYTVGSGSSAGSSSSSLCLCLCLSPPFSPSFLPSHSFRPTSSVAAGSASAFFTETPTPTHSLLHG